MLLTTAAVDEARERRLSAILKHGLGTLPEQEYIFSRSGNSLLFQTSLEILNLRALHTTVRPHYRKNAPRACPPPAPDHLSPVQFTTILIPFRKSPFALRRGLQTHPCHQPLVLL
ncbi:unnamed protein product [Allacma fusca]|uniref:Uncharacterized protein n=1 Tax=Allacma fusca TaxID=39272 RepID=A0A8J2L2E8_9HEXA|nr:unnamed protein product [Allacma fusca]